MTKAKILKRSGMMNESCTCLEKAKKLDLSDRYLNAKHAKILTRIGKIDEGVTVMKEFVKDPLNEGEMEYYQCFWHEIECANAYLQMENLFLLINYLKQF